MRFIQKGQVCYKYKNEQNRGQTRQNICKRKDLVQVLAEDSPSNTTMKYFEEFKWSRDNTKDDLQSGHPKTSTTDEQADAIHHMVLDDTFLTIQLIVKFVFLT